MSMFVKFVGTIVGGLGIGYIIPKMQEWELNREKRNLYKELNLGKYDDAAKEAMHQIDLSHMTLKEGVNQLDAYASWGLGTAFNRDLMDAKHPFPKLNQIYIKQGLTEEKKQLDLAVDLIQHIDCMDAGLPQGDFAEVRRCNELAEFVENSYRKLDKTERVKSEFAVMERDLANIRLNEVRKQVDEVERIAVQGGNVSNYTAKVLYPYLHSSYVKRGFDEELKLLERVTDMFNKIDCNTAQKPGRCFDLKQSISRLLNDEEEDVITDILY